jgi:hypothetical protein
MMIFRLASVLALVLLLAPQPLRAEDTHTEGQIWLYGNVTGVITPAWAFTVMPGIRYELADNLEDAGGVTMYELFTGPMFTHRFGQLRLRLPLWYYYMGFPIKAKNDYFDSHNVELIPMLDYTWGNLTLSSRSIFHNKLYADNSVFTSDSQRNGYSLLLRQMLQVSWSLTSKVALTLADEVFLGLVEDGETNDLAKGEPFFEKRGFSMNRVYAGASVAIVPGVSVVPQYVLETHHDPDKDSELTRVRHYLFVTVNAAVNLF